MDKAAREAAIHTGMSVKRMDQFRMIAAKSASELANLGISAEKAGAMQEAFSDATGNQVMLTKQSLVTMGALAKTTGMAEEEMAGLVGQMGDFGMGAASARGMISAVIQRTNKLGLNTKNVMKKITQNMGLLNKLSFKNGVAGLARMARISEKYKLSMEAAAGFAEKVMRPEGAIEAAANLQVLGGGLAQMGDAFQLMGQARNNPEEFMRSITKAAAETAQWDQASKSFKVSAYQMDRLREASEATGISIEELVGTAKQTAKINAFGSMVKISGDDKEFLTSVMELDSKGQAFVVDEKGYKQYLKDLSATQQQDIANRMMADKETEQQRAIAIQTTQERVLNRLDSILAMFFDDAMEFDNKFRGTLEKWGEDLQNWIKDTFTKLPWMPKLILGLMALAALSAPILVLASVMRTFWTVGKGIISGLGSLFKGGASAATGSLTGGKGVPLNKHGVPLTKSQLAFQKNMSGKTASGGQSGVNPSQTGDAAGKSAGNMLKGAAAILILSAALFVFAKAMQELVGIPLETYVGAAAGLGMLALTAKLMAKGSQDMILGALAIVILAAALVPFAFAMQLMGQATNQFSSFIILALGLTGLAIAASLIGAVSPMVLLGALAIGVLSLALIPLAYAVKIVSEGISMVVDSFTNMFSVINISNIGPLLLLGPALIGTSIGVFALSASLLALGAAWWFGGSAFTDLTHSLAALKGLDLSGMSSSISAINRVDMAKIEAIRDLASMLSLVSLFGGIKIEFGDIDVKGNINLKGDKNSSDLVIQEPYLSKLKDLIWEATSKGRKGGKV
jgi:hypothetical protein